MTRPLADSRYAMSITCTVIGPREASPYPSSSRSARNSGIRWYTESIQSVTAAAGSRRWVMTSAIERCG